MYFIEKIVHLSSAGFLKKSSQQILLSYLSAVTNIVFVVSNMFCRLAENANLEGDQTTVLLVMKISSRGPRTL